MITLYSADVCPFAQRTRALLTRLQVPFESRIVDLDDRDPEFLELSPTGKVPLLVDGDVKLYESMVVNDYLAEQHGFGSAYPGDAHSRARQRLAMLQWDQTILGPFYRSLRGEPIDGEVGGKIDRELDELQDTVRALGDVDNLLAFHCASFWARMDWLRELTPFANRIDARSDLKRWLDRAVAQPAVQATLPEREATVRSYRERFGPSAVS